MSNKTLVLIIVAILVVGAGIAGYIYWQQTKPLVVSMQDTSQSSPEPNPSAAPTPTPTPSASNASTTPQPQTLNGCERLFDPTKLANNTNLNIQNRQVEINVKGYGNITLEFYPSDAPKAVENFLRLTDSGYYNCLTFHRIAAGFVIQGGDPSGNGTGGTSAFGSPFEDELNSAAPSYKAGYVHGVLAMANSGPNTNGSQFFIMLGDNTTLPHAYTIFGKVISGLDVVDKIGQLQTNPPGDGMPTTPVVMDSVKIIK